MDKTYLVQYWPLTSTSAIPVSVTVTARAYGIEDGFVVFVDEQNHKTFAVPVALNPVVTQATIN